MSIRESIVVAIKTAIEATRLAAEALRSSPEYQEFAANEGPVSLVRGSYTRCRQILPVADGTIVVVQPDGTPRPLTVKASVALNIEAIELTSNTGIVQVMW